MRKRFITIVLLVIGILLVLLSSCVQNKGNGKNKGRENKKNNTDKIQLWHYHQKNDYQCRVIDRVKEYLVDNPIPVEIHIYSEDTITVENYILKRNLASGHGNMVVIDDITLMYDLSESNADYKKLENYNNLLSGYKDKFCIPLGVSYNAVSLENDIFKYYDINTPEKQIMTYIDYLHVKQDMKGKGAKFKLSYREFSELIDYYLNENKLLFADQNSNIIKNNEEFRELLKKSILSISEDIQSYHDEPLLTYEEYLNNPTLYYLYDETSKLFLSNNFNLNFIINPYDYENIEGHLNKTFVIHINGAYSSPSFYMHKKITNDKIYDLANYIVNESSYLKILGSSGMKGFYFAPVFNTNNTKAMLQLNDDWEIKDECIEAKKETSKIVNGAYELLVKNETKSKEIANYYFNNAITYKNDLKKFIISFLYDIAQELSGRNSSLENFDSTDDKINKLIDDKIDEFIKNLFIHNS
jgi:hypothetical protein